MSEKAVLIIDDEPLLSLYLSDLVEDFGFSLVGTASTPTQARQLAEARAPSIALVDVALQETEDGIAVAGELSKRYGTAIILISGYSEVADMPAVQALQAVAVLQKPCFPSDLKRALDDAIRVVDAKTA